MGKGGRGRWGGGGANKREGQLRGRPGILAESRSYSMCSLTGEKRRRWISNINFYLRTNVSFKNLHHVYSHLLII